MLEANQISIGKLDYERARFALGDSDRHLDAALLNNAGVLPQLRSSRALVQTRPLASK